MPHRHFTASIVVGLTGPFAFRAERQRRRLLRGVAVAPNVSQQMDCAGQQVAILQVDPETEPYSRMARLFAEHCLPTAAHTNPFLAAYWDDLNPWDTAIRYGTVGTAPNRVFIVDYKVDLASGNEGSDDTQFQVQIHEGSSLINVRYWDKQSGVIGQQATIGFQSAGGASAAAYPLICNARILDDNDPSHEGWSIHPKSNGAMSIHAVNAFSPDDINGTNIPGLLGFSGDDVTQNVTLPFTLTLDGVDYTTLTLSTNGWAEIGGNTSGDSDPTTDCLPTAAHSNPFIAMFWDDMRTAGTSSVQYGTVGSAPNRTFLAQFFLDIKTSPNDGEDDVRVQLQIHEGSNAISVKYPPSEVLANGQTATIGYQSAGGAAATATAIGCNAKVLDDNIPDSGWSVSPLPECGNGITEPRGSEQCDGTTPSCPADTLQPGGTVCRADAGECDVAEECDGVSADCPADAVEPAGTACGDGSDSECTDLDTCDGAGTCQANHEPPTTVCRAASAGEACDAVELCDGAGSRPADGVEPAGTVCRADAGACDVAETCTGSSPSCPDDGFEPDGTACDDGQFCTGIDQCQAGFCASAGSPCDLARPATRRSTAASSAAARRPRRAARRRRRRCC